MINISTSDSNECYTKSKPRCLKGIKAQEVQQLKLLLFSYLQQFSQFQSLASLALELTQVIFSPLLNAHVLSNALDE